MRNIDDIVKARRIYHFGTQSELKLLCNQELIADIDNAGLIRHDLDDYSFALMRLYYYISDPIISGTERQKRMDYQYPRKVFKTNRLGRKFFGRNYDNFQCPYPQDEVVCLVKQFIESHLNDDEAKLIELLFGLYDGTFYNDKSYIRTTMNLSDIEMHKLFSVAMSKLIVAVAKNDTLPYIGYIPEHWPRTIGSLNTIHLVYTGLGINAYCILKEMGVENVSGISKHKKDIIEMKQPGKNWNCKGDAKERIENVMKNLGFNSFKVTE